MPCPYDLTRIHLVRTKFTRQIAAFWIIRITRGRLRFAGGMCRKYCWAGITRRYASGGGVARWKRLGAIGRSCSMGLGWARRTAGCWMRLRAARGLSRSNHGEVIAVVTSGAMLGLGDALWCGENEG